jgi:hypothetical protein
MPENHDELDGFDKRSDSNEEASFDEPGGSSGHVDFDLQGGSDERGSFDEQDDSDEQDDFDEDDDEAVRSWAGAGNRPAGYPPGGYPQLLSGRSRGDGRGARRGVLLAVTAVVAAAAGFGVVAVAIRDVSGSPAASATPSVGSSGAGAPSSGAGSGTQLAPQAGGVPSPPPGATMQLEIGGPVTAVSATSITVGTGDHVVTAAVTRATTITGKATSIGGIKVGDLVSASISGTNGKLIADSIQDPASLPSGLGQ